MVSGPGGWSFPALRCRLPAAVCGLGVTMSDDLPERPKARLNILPLDMLGVTELRAYIAELQSEIARAEAMILRKDAHRGAVESVFGRPGFGQPGL